MADKVNSKSCNNCPRTKGEVFTAELRGSSFRGRFIEDGEAHNVDRCVFMIGDILVAEVRVANTDQAAAEQDAEVLTSVFEAELEECNKPTTILTGDGLQTVCTPINAAVDYFIKANYPE